MTNKLRLEQKKIQTKPAGSLDVQEDGKFLADPYKRCIRKILRQNEIRKLNEPTIGYLICE
jgi:hypothetical protein